jgi:hypothetical protein
MKPHLRPWTLCPSEIQLAAKNDLDRRRRYGRCVTDGWISLDFHQNRTGRDASSNAAPSTKNDQMTKKSTTNADDEGGVQIPAQVRDRMSGFHEDSMKTAVSPHIAMHSQQKTEMNQCL